MLRSKVSLREMLRETRGGSWHPVNWSEGLDLGRGLTKLLFKLGNRFRVTQARILDCFRVHLFEVFAAHLLVVLAVGASPPAASGVQGLGDRSVLLVLVPGGLGTLQGIRVFLLIQVPLFFEGGLGFSKLCFEFLDSRVVFFGSIFDLSIPGAGAGLRLPHPAAWRRLPVPALPSVPDVAGWWRRVVGVAGLVCSWNPKLRQS